MTMLIAHDGGCVVVRLCWAAPVTRVITAA